MNNQIKGRFIEILLVEDNPRDVLLTVEILKESKIRYNLHIAQDGVEAIEFLSKEGKYSDVPRPDLILLDLNLPKKSGHEVLAEIKADKETRCIPVVVFTSSKSDEDILKSYDLHANFYLNKPIDLEQYMNLVRIIEDLWIDVAKLPPRVNGKI